MLKRSTTDFLIILNLLSNVLNKDKFDSSHNNKTKNYLLFFCHKALLE